MPRLLRLLPEVPCVLVAAGGRIHFVFEAIHWPTARQGGEQTMWPTSRPLCDNGRIVLTEPGGARSDFCWKTLTLGPATIETGYEMRGDAGSESGRTPPGGLSARDLAAAGTAAALALRLTGGVLPEPHVHGRCASGLFAFFPPSDLWWQGSWSVRVPARNGAKLRDRTLDVAAWLVMHGEFVPDGDT